MYQQISKTKGVKHMKKILTILAATATMFAFGEDINQGADFEAPGFGGGDPLVAIKDNVQDDNAGTTGAKYWYTEDADAANVISNYVGETDATTPIGMRPDKFKQANNTKFLQVETTGRLYRSVKDNEASGNFLTNTIESLEIYGFAITNSAIYLDTLVKFTAADSVFGDDALAEGDKIAIEYVEHESEGDGDPTVTNFVIRAGFKVGNEVFPTNYYAYLPNDPTLANFDKDAWHRLTVRTIPNVGDGSVGFVVYVDQTNLVYSTDVSAGFGVIDPSVQGFYNNNTHALFPSAILAGDIGGKTITSAAFSGNGSLDDVVFTTGMPKFIKDSESVIATFTADSGVTAIRVWYGPEEEDAVNVDMTAQTLAATLPAGTTDFTVTATIDEANGYTFNKMTVGEDVYDTNPANITNYAGGAIAITTTRNNFNLFDENGDPISGKYQKLSDALAVEGVAKIQLAHDYDVLAVEGDGFAGYSVGGEIVLDLAGNDINGGDDSAGVSLFTVTDTFTIIDSVGGGAITYDTQYGYAIIKLDGSDVFVGASTGDAGATFNGKLFESGFEGKIIRGYIDDANNVEEGAFAWSGYVDSNSTLSDAAIAGYWVVTPKGAVGTYSITVTPTENATYSAVYTDSGAAIEPVNNVYTVVSGKTITITATPAEGFEYASEPDGWTLSEGVITKVVNEAVAIPAPTAKQIIGTYEVVVTPDANATYAAICTNDDSAVVFNENITTVRVGYAIMITATPNENYEYANTPEGWTAGANGVITKVVDAAGTVAIPAPTVKSSYPTYIDTTDDTIKGKYDTWAQAYGADTASAYETAFLLNIAPDAEDQTLKPTAITMEGGKVVITANQTLTSVNGKVYVKVATTLAGLSTAEWAEATLSEGKVQVTPGSSDTAGFYKIKVDF